MTVAKIVDLIGVSFDSWDDAARNAVKDASETIDNITGVEVISNTANVKEDKLTEYKAHVRIVFDVVDR